MNSADQRYMPGGYGGMGAADMSPARSLSAGAPQHMGVGMGPGAGRFPSGMMPPRGVVPPGGAGYPMQQGGAGRGSAPGQSQGIPPRMAAAGRPGGATSLAGAGMVHPGVVPRATSAPSAGMRGIPGQPVVSSAPLDMNDFPALSSGGQPPRGMFTGGAGGPSGPSPPLGSMPGPGAQASSQGFNAEDFPALPGSQPSASGAGAATTQPAVASSSSQSGQRQGVQASSSQHFGMLGLVGLLQNANDMGGAALSADLTALGLNLNQAEPLYESLHSPWGDGGRPLAKDALPSTFLNKPPAITPQNVSKFSETTLLYMFYVLHRDIVNQYPRDRIMRIAATELSQRRGWAYSRERKVWLRQLANGQLVFCDPNTLATTKAPADWKLPLPSSEGMP